ncbi:MAG: hypothetical protein C4306_11565 [Thermoleophilia bacterium]
MSEIALAILALLAIGEFLLFGAVAESFRDIDQLRRVTGAMDELQPVDLGDAVGGQPSAFGLDPFLDEAGKGLALFVDSRCSTCQRIVRSLNGRLPAGTSLVLFADTEDQGVRWLTSSGFDAERLRDLPVRIVTSADMSPLGIDVTPLAVEVENGRIARAFAVPSTRRFYALVPDVHGLLQPRRPASEVRA